MIPENRELRAIGSVLARGFRKTWKMDWGGLRGNMGILVEFWWREDKSPR
jgi:hypothetical protein